jgi:subtilisin family serine protease
MASNDPTRPERTVLDATLAFMARTAGTAAPTDLSREFAARALSTTTHDADVAPSFTPDRRETIKLLVQPGGLQDALAWLGAHGGDAAESAPDDDATPRGGYVLLAHVPVAALAELEAQPWIQRAEGPRLLLRRLDEARGAATGLDAAVTASGLTGEGVLVAVVDTGVDYTHADFRNPNGSTRLELFVHAHAPPGGGSNFDEFDRQAIDQALTGGTPIPQGDSYGHGTHCASIAAGNGAASGGQFRGVAPSASLMAVRSEPLLDTHTIWGIRRAFELAGDRPAVVSLSLGGHLGPHDGTSALENVIARESGPGRIVIVAAGNEGGDQIHVRGDLVEGQDLVIPVRIGDQNLQFVDVWLQRGDEVDAWIETPDGVRHDPDGQTVNTVFGQFMADFRTDPLNRDQNLTLLIGGGRVNFQWKVGFRPTRVVGGDVHAWAGTVNPSTSAFLFPGASSPAYSIGMPGTEERAIVVGSFVSRTSFVTAAGNSAPAQGLQLGQLSPFSSHGPGRYGALKPDVAAPGQYVTAALASNSKFATDPAYTPRHSPDGKYITIQGTSMATPFVAGVVALLLGREPRLNPEEIQQRLRVTARRDADTGRIWSTGFGFGKLDAEALLAFAG